MPLGLEILLFFILGLFALYLVTRIITAAAMKSINEAKKSGVTKRRRPFYQSNKEHK